MTKIVRVRKCNECGDTWFAELPSGYFCLGCDARRVKKKEGEKNVEKPDI